MRHRSSVLACLTLILPCGVAAQSSGRVGAIEDIFIVRSLRLSRETPSDYCAESRTSFPASQDEDRYHFLAVTTAPGGGVVSSTSGPVVGNVHACFGPTADPVVSMFYAQGQLNGISFTGHGQCRTTRTDFPEPGISVATCYLILSDLPSQYAGGMLTSNTVVSRQVIGPVSDPPGYTQPSIATVRLWKKR